MRHGGGHAPRPLTRAPRSPQPPLAEIGSDAAAADRSWPVARRRPGPNGLPKNWRVRRLLSMSVSAPTALRGLGLTTIVLALLALSACGINYDVTIHSDDTVDLTVVFWGLDKMTMESACSAEGLGDSSPSSGGVKPTYTLTEYNGHPACEISAEAVPLSQFSDSHEDLSITHSDGEFEVTVPSTEFDDTYEGLDSRYTVTFPGRVIEASGSARIDGNTVTWDNYLAEGRDLHAIGKDSSGPPWARIAGVGVAAMVVGGGVALVTTVSVRRRRSAADTPPVPYGQASMPYQWGATRPEHAQPGYSQPGQAEPGYAQPAYTQPSWSNRSSQTGYTQPWPPDYSQSGHAQPGQYPYDPDGRYGPP